MDPDIRDMVSYCPDSGILRWKAKHGRSPIKVGKIAGAKTKGGYWALMYRGKTLQAHRVAWYIMTGSWPAISIDHINLDRMDNRWSNLREATGSQNKANSYGKSRYGKGVSLTPVGRYRAKIRKNGVDHYLGTFDSPEQAQREYAIAAVRLFGEFARV